MNYIVRPLAGSGWLLVAIGLCDVMPQPGGGGGRVTIVIKLLPIKSSKTRTEY